MWSPLEYGCHVRDVHVLFAQRLRADARRGRADLRQLGPGRHRRRERLRQPGPDQVAVELIEAAGHRRGIYATVTDETHDRPGVRSNGDRFTVETLGSYHLHDVVHHLHDVGAG